MPDVRPPSEAQRVFEPFGSRRSSFQPKGLRRGQRGRPTADLPPTRQSPVRSPSPALDPRVPVLIASLSPSPPQSRVLHWFPVQGQHLRLMWRRRTPSHPLPGSRRSSSLRVSSQRFGGSLLSTPHPKFLSGLRLGAVHIAYLGAPRPSPCTWSRVPSSFRKLTRPARSGGLTSACSGLATLAADARR